MNAEAQHDHQVFIDLSFEGWQYNDADVALLEDEFRPIGLVHASAMGGPAALPAAAITIAVTFIGAKLLDLVTERTLERVWQGVINAWNSYRTRRTSLGLEDPEIARFLFRTNEFEVEYNGFIDPDSDVILDVLALMCERRATGKLREQPIRVVRLPSFKTEDGWHAVEVQEYADTGDPYIWYVASRTITPALGFYDSRRDEWL